MAQISNQFAHIFIHYYSNKSASVCKLFISEPTQNQERLLGRLFGILEINTPSRENTQLINHLISNLENIYYSHAENEDLDAAECFEKTLKEVNQEFTELIKNKQISMVGNLNENTIREKINLSIGVMKDNQINFTYLNNINIYLIHKTKQDYKIIDIKKIAQEGNETPESKESTSLFANMLSGEVNPPDFLILANANFTEYISLERIQKIITSLPLHKATEYFKNSLLKFEGQNFAAILIKNSVDQAETAKEPASLTSITELNYTESKTEKLLAPSIWNMFKNGKDKIFSSLGQFTKETPSKKTQTDTERPALVAEPKTIAAKTNYLISLNNLYLRIKKPLKNFYTDSKFANNLKNKLRLRLSIWRNKFKTVPNLSKTLLIIAGILLVLFVFSIFYFKQQQKETISQNEYQGLITQIEEKKSQAESDLIYGNEDKAKTEIAEAQALLDTLPIDSTSAKESKEKLNQAIWQIVAKLRHITIVEEPVLIADLASQQETAIDIQNILYANNGILAFDSLNNTNYQINLENREIKLNLSNLSDIGTISRVKQIDDKIIAYHNKNAFVEFKDNKYSPISIAVSPNAQIADYVAYNSRLYTVDTSNNQIYRLPKIDTGYDTGLTWLKTTEDLKDIGAMAIDTSIWLLDKKGPILKFTKGNKQAFEIKNLEPVLENPTRLFTDDQTNYLYILEPKSKRIVVLDKSGNLAAQYYNDNFNNLQDFAIYEKEKKIFISNDNKIYFFTLTHIK
jgi:hypothetical protein